MRFPNKLTIIMAFLISFHVAVFADITGVVKDSSSGLALADVTVYIKGNLLSKTTSDQKGLFTIKENTGVTHNVIDPFQTTVWISPNGQLYLSGFTGEARITISSIQGAQVWKNKLVFDRTLKSISLPYLAHGLYIIDVLIDQCYLRFKTISAAGKFSQISILENKKSSLNSLTAYSNSPVTLVFEKLQYITKEYSVSGSAPIQVLLVHQNVISTGGSGGLTFSSTGIAGEYKYGKVKIGTVEIKVFEPVDNKPRQLSFYLHGDMADDYQNDKYYSHATFAKWAKANNAIYVAALAPNKCSWWRAPNDDCTGAEIVDNKGENADALDSVIKVLGKKYNFYKYPILYCGVSGGSTFLSRLYFSRYAEKYPGAFVMNCGGGPTLLQWSWDHKIDSLRNRNWMLFNWGSNDFLNEHIEKGVSAYRNLKITVEAKKHPGQDHCAPGIEIEKNTFAFWEKHLTGGTLAKKASDVKHLTVDNKQQRSKWVDGAKKYINAMEMLK